MKITFTGKQDKLNPSQERKLAMAFSRLSKLVERRGEKGVQVILSSERHLQHAEVRVNFFDQTIIGEGAASDQFTAMMDAVGKVEKRAAKSREKWRDTTRVSDKREVSTPVEAAPAPAARKTAKAKPVKAKPAKVVRASAKSNGKPMTVDEALITMEDDRDYVVYRDADTDKVSVLIRRRDGKVDLVEA